MTTERVIEWSGEVDVARVQTLTAEFETVLRVASTGRLVFDLSDVTFLDFSGAGVLLDARNQCAERDVELALRAPSPSVRRTLGLGDLLDVFTIVGA